MLIWNLDEFEIAKATKIVRAKRGQKMLFFFQYLENYWLNRKSWQDLQYNFGPVETFLDISIRCKNRKIKIEKSQGKLHTRAIATADVSG